MWDDQYAIAIALDNQEGESAHGVSKSTSITFLLEGSNRHFVQHNYSVNFDTGSYRTQKIGQWDVSGGHVSLVTYIQSLEGT